MSTQSLQMTDCLEKLDGLTRTQCEKILREMGARDRAALLRHVRLASNLSFRVEYCVSNVDRAERLATSWIDGPGIAL